MDRTAAQLRTSATSDRATMLMDEIGSPGSVDPKMKTARSAISAPTTSRQPHPVMPDRGSVGA